MPVTTSPTPRQVSKQRCRSCGSGARDLLASVGLAGPDRRPGETSEPAPELGRQEGERSQERLPRGAPRERLDQRSEEHTSELQSRQYLVCRLLLEKKKKIST